ncbi:MAG TPA: apolipoprotein N-acyltransferase, partial [Aquabacterium sp.]|nr:apolipoprotein N-acyltransferase [Aquabacterium sp.]
AIAGGICHAFALTPWVDALWPPLAAVLQTLGMAALLWSLLGTRTSGQAALATWLYGTFWLIGGTGWTYVSLHRYGGLPAWLSALSVVALSLFLSIYLAAAGWLWSRRPSQAGVWHSAAGWGSLWLLAELARAMIFTGFPWASSGYGLIDVAWRLLAPWIGVYGVGALWAVCVAAAVLTLHQWCLAGRSSSTRLSSGLVLGALTCSIVWQPDAAGARFTKPIGRAISVTLLQGNVPQDEKFEPELQVPMLMWHAKAMLSAQTDLVVAPETAIPLLPSQLPDDYWSGLLEGFKVPGRHALFGIPLGSFEAGYTNSVVGLSAQTSSEPGGYYRYDKHHLVPFGEFIPWGFHWFVQLMNMPLGDFDRGPLVTPSFVVLGQRIAPTICYEDLYGEEIAARFTRPYDAPTILANVSNLAWFGDDVAIFQHQQIARMRSIEFQVPTIRATNTGATMVVGADGAIQKRLPPNSRGQLVTTVQGYSGVTPYAWWAGRWGLWPLVMIGCVAAIALNRIQPLRRRNAA